MSLLEKERQDIYKPFAGRKYAFEWTMQWLKEAYPDLLDPTKPNSFLFTQVNGLGIPPGFKNFCQGLHSHPENKHYVTDFNHINPNQETRALLLEESGQREVGLRPPIDLHFIHYGLNYQNKESISAFSKANTSLLAPEGIIVAMTEDPFLSFSPIFQLRALIRQARDKVKTYPYSPQKIVDLMSAQKLILQTTNSKAGYAVLALADQNSGYERFTGSQIEPDWKTILQDKARLPDFQLALL